MTNTIEYIVSVDDHVVEHANVWQDRIPASLRDRAPRWERGDDGVETWVYEGKRIPITGTLTVAQNWGNGEWTAAPVSFDDMSPSMYDPNERLKVMDEDGVY
jgi:hypothetical protein